MGGGAGCGVDREVRNAGRPVRANKEKSSVRGAMGVRGFLQGKQCRQARQANFGSVRGGARLWGCPHCAGCRKRKGYGDVRCAPARQGWAGADAVEKAPRNDTVRGVQGSCGPLVGGRRIETAGPLVLSVTKEQR